MKAFLMIALLMSSTAAHAGLARFDSSEFNAVIEESQSAEKQLRKELRANAGFRKAERRKNGMHEIASANSGSVNVPSQIFKPVKKKGSNSREKAADSQEYDRLTQELGETY